MIPRTLGGRAVSLADAAANRLPTAPPNFDWGLHPQAEKLLLSKLDGFVASQRFAADLEDRLSQQTGTLLIDWIDHLVLADGPGVRAELLGAGFQVDPAGDCPPGEIAHFHPHGVFPRVVLHAGGGRDGTARSDGAISELALKPESAADMLAALDICDVPEGPPLSRHRRAILSTQAGLTLSAVERRAYRGFGFEYPAADHQKRVLQARELWTTRPRRGASDEELFEANSDLADRAFALVGRDLAAHLFFEVERDFWQRRNGVARFQKHRQDLLGLGWGNHDHHTYRASRANFRHLIAFLEKLGFHLRERYHAGDEAGWGAQIVEHPVLDITCFCDVDLSADERELDFAHVPLPARDKLGTVGLWVGLHGESFLQAGMHHLECRFDFEKLKTDLEAAGFQQMKPFSDFDFLRQAFTAGERWRVDRDRTIALRDAGLITPAQCEKFLAEGAVGSHLENLQRRQGFKGFNQKSVSAIISATDPRKQIHAA